MNPSTALSRAPRTLAQSCRPVYAYASTSATPLARPQTRSFHRATRIPSLTSSQARKRPNLNTECQTSATFRQSIPMTARTIFIQTQDTPNVDALKFIPNHPVLPQDFPSGSLEYTSPRSTLAPPYPSPLAGRLLGVDGVSSVFYGPDFITVTKITDTNWAHIKPEVFSLITEAVSSGEQIVAINKDSPGGEHGPPIEEDSLAIRDDDDEVVAMIKELLETRVRPAIQDDGGDLEFRGFDDGIVKLKLRGACRTCDSSTVTLKNGIESMLMHYIEEVKGIEQVLDEEELIAEAEFKRFEEKLKAQKGSVPPTTSGKDSLDFVQ